jgi:hypothetical protein
LSFISERGEEGGGRRLSLRTPLTQADLEYELCGSFLRHTGQRLSARES